MFEELYDFFDHYEPMQGFFEQHDPDFQEVMTRVFLFKNSTMRQRLDALKHHFTILRTFFSDDVIREIYWGKGYTLWTSDDPSMPLEVRLIFDTGQRKEGFLSLYLYHEGQMIYHLTSGSITTEMVRHPCISVPSKARSTAWKRPRS